MNIMLGLALSFLLNGVIFLVMGFILWVIKRWVNFERLRVCLFLVGWVYVIVSTMAFIIIGLYKLAYGC